MGLTRQRWVLSLILNVTLAGFFAMIMLFEVDLSAINPTQLGRAAFVLLVGTLFELFLYFGFIHLRLETAFGTIPAILVTSVIYVLWHAGTQLPLEPDVVAAVWKLFLVGVLYQSVFCVTHNLLAIWPFFAGVGVMFDFVVNIDAVGPTSRHFPWAVGAAVAMAVVGAILAFSNRPLRE